jgi:hypothetical protein
MVIIISWDYEFCSLNLYNHNIILGDLTKSKEFLIISFAIFLDLFRNTSFVYFNQV